jgi:hypothetical protein
LDGGESVIQTRTVSMIVASSLYRQILNVTFSVATARPPTDEVRTSSPRYEGHLV